jgi:hypothetical protein
MQPHPEFVPDYSRFLLNKRREQLGQAAWAEGLASLSLGHEGLSVAREIVRFIG